MNALNKLADVERKFDGALPQSTLAAIRHGSAIRAQLADHEGQLEFYRDMLLKSVRSGKEWFRRGQLANAESCRKDGWIYLAGWRHHRKVVEGIKEAIASMVAEEESQEQREANSQFGLER